MSRIDLYHRPHDWMATIEGNLGRWECGKSPEEAIRKLNVSFPDTIKQEIIYRGKEFSCEGYALVLEVLHER